MKQHMNWIILLCGVVIGCAATKEASCFVADRYRVPT